MCYDIQAVKRQRTYGRVVELVDSLDSGSSVHCGRAGSSPASPTKRRKTRVCVSFFFYAVIGTLTDRKAAIRWTAAGEGLKRKDGSLIKIKLKYVLTLIMFNDILNIIKGGEHSGNRDHPWLDGESG